MSVQGIQPAADFFSESPMTDEEADVYKLRNQIIDDLERKKRERISKSYVVPVRDWKVGMEPVLQAVMEEFRRMGYKVERDSFRGMSLGLRIGKKIVRKRSGSKKRGSKNSGATKSGARKGARKKCGLTQKSKS